MEVRGTFFGPTIILITNYLIFGTGTGSISDIEKNFSCMVLIVVVLNKSYEETFTVVDCISNLDTFVRSNAD